MWLPSLAQNWVLIFPGDQLPCHPCPGKQQGEDGSRVSDHQAITKTVPQGNGKDCWRWRLTREAEMMGTDDGYLCTYLQGLQHSLWVCIGDTGSLHATEGRDQTGFRNSSPQKKQPGVQEPHHLHLPETWVNCSSTQSPGSPHFMRKHA